MVSFYQIKEGFLGKTPDVEQYPQNVTEENKSDDKITRSYDGRWYFVQLAGVIGAFAVALGAYGSHALHPRPDVSQERKDIFDTGNFYHFIHALTLLGAPLTNKPTLVGVFMLLGICLFCGSCYITGITGNFQVAAATPFGGISFILGWTCMIL